MTGRGSCDTGLFRTMAKIATDARAVKSSPGTNFANFVGACTEMTERLRVPCRVFFGVPCRVFLHVVNRQFMYCDMVFAKKFRYGFLQNFFAKFVGTCTEMTETWNNETKLLRVLEGLHYSKQKSRETSIRFVVYFRDIISPRKTQGPMGLGVLRLITSKHVDARN